MKRYMRTWGFIAAAAMCAGLTLAPGAQIQQPRVKTPTKAAPKSTPVPDQNPAETTIKVDITRVNILFTAINA